MTNGSGDKGSAGEGLKPREPGDKGYAYYWRKVVARSNLPSLKGLSKLDGFGNVSGKAVLDVLKVYGEYANDRTGEAWPKQGTLASESGWSERTARDAQAAAMKLGYLEFRAPASPGRRGRTYRCVVPPDWETLADRTLRAIYPENRQVDGGEPASDSRVTGKYLPTNSKDLNTHNLNNHSPEHSSPEHSEMLEAFAWLDSQGSASPSVEPDGSGDASASSEDQPIGGIGGMSGFSEPRGSLADKVERRRRMREGSTGETEPKPYRSRYARS